MAPPNQSMRPQSNTEIVDICDLFLNFVSEFPLPRDIKARVNLDELKGTDLDFSRLRIVNKEANHLPTVSTVNVALQNGINENAHTQDSSQKGEHRKNFKSHVLFFSTFTNSTSETQTNHLRTERRTSSSCRVSVHRGVTKDGSFSLQISPPGSVLQANVGFRREVTMGQEREQVFEEELIWSLDTEVIVPPGYRTRAELVITEDEYDGRFRVESIFEGSVCCKLRDKKDGSLVYNLVMSNLPQVLKPDQGFQPVPGRPAVVIFISEGNCHCHFGIGQRVDLQQEKI